MKNLGLGVLEEFAEAASLGREDIRGSMIVGTPPTEKVEKRPRVKDAEHRQQWKAAWNRKPEVMARSRARAAIQRAKKALMQVEIFWDGVGWFYARRNDSERLGGPFDTLHQAWTDLNSKGLEVVEVTRTRKTRSYLKVKKLPEE